ncbi:MAG: RNA polymerase sigma factor [Pseudomonadota bacterium]
MADTGTQQKLDVYLHEQRDLLAAACAIVGSPHVAEDLVQDCWLRWNARDYRPDQARPILLRIVKNLAIDWHRRRRVEFETLEAHRILQESPLDAERILDGKQQLSLVIKALEELPPRTLLAFRYSRVEGLTLKEAGRKMGVSESRVSQLVSDAVLRIVSAIDV